MKATNASSNRQWTVVKYAACSRLFSLGLGMVSSAIVGDYDASAQMVLDRGQSLGARVLYVLAHSLLRWDAFYFVHIAGNGYIYEQEHAFFPLLPQLMRLLSAALLAPLVDAIGEPAVLVIAGAIISNVCFVLAAVVLYRLGCCTLSSERLAFIAAVLFAFAPSNMFMSAAYTESLFALLAFTALLLVAWQHHFAAALCLGASTLCRSNGIVYAGFIVWDLVVKRDAGNRSLRQAAVQLLRATALTAVSALGFIAFQIYGYRQHCLQPLYPALDRRPYCNGAPATLYSFVQAEYWNVGFLKYYTWQQLPNFALAAPMIVLSGAGLCTFAARDPLYVATLGRRRCCPQSRSADRLLPHVYLWALLLALAATTMHVQVITRFFSSVPAVFWYAAHVAAGRQQALRWAVVGYFAAYGLAGVVLFSSFFPPA
ncbi:ER membrane glycoprotein subunit of the GPI transamidase complex-like protein [Coemansia sp. RSA 989]|nr:GPI mannosyltransferase 2 [Coemansia mojavensis]KAJ1737925.1 ER membrane glycoprotein subunit of the GPI transamidase complex-like protein [Coemansia sp. RSA 1086]KAJ1746446.1 ER membrane glycoprotein subunit of the GPI transamidase complex-like protein [Coemansia sp. RSA 1821]KAJ1860366.1 ER membrane glycoprotein subunit of the GPI transamidase complex-like protein [Coemansia sp. RSA 989]KAJ2667284.1 ER membrane glycoprotein subunit of the GPI transamidase complex-like protein [Coemansia sp